MWKVSNTPENPIAAKTYKIRIIFMTRNPISVDVSNLVRVIIIWIKTKNVRQNTERIKLKKYL